MFYNVDFDRQLLKDLQSHDYMIYNSTYRHIYSGKRKGQTDIYLNGRGRTCGKKAFKVLGFLPYGYIYSDKGEYKTYQGKSVDKILFETEPRRVADLRRHFEEIDRDNIPPESDILYTRRFLIDTYDFFKPGAYVDPKIAIMDLETNFPVNNNIISFAINGYDGELYYNSLNDESNKYSLLLDLYSRMIEYDIIANWNIDFDIKALQPKLERIRLAFKPLEEEYTLSKDGYIRKLATDYNLFGIPTAIQIIDALIEYGYLKIDNEIVAYGDKEFNTDITFIITPLDLIPISKKMYGREIPGRWSLDNTGKQICGIGKYETGKKYSRDMTPDELLEYNVRDVIVPEIIDNYLGGIQCHVILAWSLQSQINDVIQTATVSDISLLRAYHRTGIVLPSRPPYKHNKEKSDGYKYRAAEPSARVGTFKDIVAADLKHAYPSAVIAINASIETKDPNGKYTAPNGVRFNSNHSIFIDTLKDLMTERTRNKKRMQRYSKDSSEYQRYKSIDFALKTESAAFSHGIFGWENSRMFDPEVADSITSVVRGMLDVIKDKCDEIGHPWVYNHTDAAYFKAPKDEAKDIVSILNNTIEEHCLKRGYSIVPILEFKGYYKKAYIHSPARNVLVDENGKWHITGLNLMRAETPTPLADIERELITMKLDEKSKEEMIERLRYLISELPNKPSSELAIIKPLTKSIKKYGRMGKDSHRIGIPYHISALTRGKDEYGMNIKVGEKFSVINILSDIYDGVRVKRRRREFMAFPLDEELSDMYSIDFEYYLKSNLWGKINGLFDLKANELEKLILTDDVKDVLNIETK